MKRQFTRLTVERYRSRNLGLGWCCTGLVNGVSFQMTYYDYTKKEAIERFREYVKEELGKCFFNQPNN